MKRARVIHWRRASELLIDKDQWQQPEQRHRQRHQQQQQQQLAAPKGHESCIDDDVYGDVAGYENGLTARRILCMALRR